MKKIFLKVPLSITEGNYFFVFSLYPTEAPYKFHIIYIRKYHANYFMKLRRVF